MSHVSPPPSRARSCSTRRAPSRAVSVRPPLLELLLHLPSHITCMHLRLDGCHSFAGCHADSRLGCAALRSVPIIIVVGLSRPARPRCDRLVSCVRDIAHLFFALLCWLPAVGDLSLLDILKITCTTQVAVFLLYVTSTVRSASNRLRLGLVSASKPDCLRVASTHYLPPPCRVASASRRPVWLSFPAWGRMTGSANA